MSCKLVSNRCHNPPLLATIRNRLVIMSVALIVVCGWSVASRAHAEEPIATESKPAAADFGSKSLDGWRVVDVFDFKDHGRVRIAEEALHLERGDPATGVSWKGDFPRSNYELSFEGRRVAGDDFFCGLTFPVKDEHCTLVLGGWGGQVVGLSNIDGYSAVENETTQAFDFQQGKWYPIRLRVTDDEILAWIDNKPLVIVETEGKKFSLYWEQEPVTPIGLVSWNTHGAIKDLKLTQLEKKDSKAADRKEADSAP